MHILHFVCIAAESPEDACDTIETYIDDFGTDDNYSRIGGCISEDNEIYIHDHAAAFLPDDEQFNTTEQVRQLVISGMTGLKTKEEIIEELRKESANINMIKEWAILKEEITLSDPTTFDLWNDNFFDSHYDRFGYTQCHYDRDSDMKKFVVFVDMHV